MSYFIWRDDFVGLELQPAYSVVLAGNGVIQASRHPSFTGWVELRAPAPGASVSRLRLGDEIANSAFDALPLWAKKHIRLETMVLLNTRVGVEATIGLIGEDDPVNVGGALLYRSGPKAGWIFQTCTDPSEQGRHDSTTCRTTALDWVHEPNAPFTVRIEATNDYSRVLIDGREYCRHTERLPVSKKQTVEYQLWNREESAGTWSSPSMFVSYLLIVQDR